MIIIGIILSFIGVAYLCWLLFALAVYALPFFALCGRPHKANYVASHDMWRTGPINGDPSSNRRLARHIFTKLQRAQEGN